MTDYTNYQSPFSWRYGTAPMRKIWSEENKRKTWRRLWVLLAEVQSEFGLTTAEQVADLRTHMEDIDVARAVAFEKDLRHDVMAEIATYAEQCQVGGGIIHLGMTSMDIVDNADVLRVRASLDLLLEQLQEALTLLLAQMEATADLPVMAFTHLQPAEPTTLGFRFAQYAQDLWMDWQNLIRLRGDLKGKGLRGAVGTSASYTELFGADNLAAFEKRISEKLALPFFAATTQVYPRKQDYDIACALAGLGASLYKFAFDLRLLQSPPLGELAEPFGRKQVGSSAMPFKRNPINTEKMDSLARWLAQFPRTAWDNAAHTLLERTLDDSANRRITLAEAFLSADELLRVAVRMFRGVQIRRDVIARNMAQYGPFAATERVLMALGKAGANRQVMHERIREHSLGAWEAVQSGAPNRLVEQITSDAEMLAYLPSETLLALMDASTYYGDAVHRTRQLTQTICADLAKTR